MTIISVTVKKGLASVELDRPDRLSVENRPVLASLFYEAGLKKGSEISPEAFCALIKQSETKRAKSRAVWYLSKKGYSVKTLHKKLCEKFLESAADAAIEFCLANGFLDDCEYACATARRLKAAGKSRRAITLYMQKDGISRDDIENALSQIPLQEDDVLSELIQRKYKNKLSEENGKQKVVAALLRRGFKYEDIKKAIDCGEFYE
ncbi:MAG: regulatory protein RecX [Oscillospiraceae bacterium]|nr:regulatory protein RecX [Candidatus Equicaccousia limihippi]